MQHINWTAINAIAGIISMVAFIASALYIRNQVRGLEKDRYVTVTNQLFTIWLSPEFMEAQLLLLHGLDSTTWSDFIRDHRGDRAEAAFHRVGAFYERVGTLSRLGLINENEMLFSIGPYAIAVWQKIEPLVKEARAREHSTLFLNFERLIPDCYECYVPELDPNARVKPFEVSEEADRTSLAQLKRRLSDAITILDVRHPHQIEEHPKRIPGARHIPAAEIPERMRELPPERDVVVYCA